MRGDGLAEAGPSGRQTSAKSGSAASNLLASIPIAVFADSYKATHPSQYPACTEMVAYGEFRHGYNKDEQDTRMVNYGIRHIIETYLHRQWTARDLELAGKFYATHCAGGTPLPWPKDLFHRIVDEHDGYFPITIQALPEGTCTNVRVPVYQITARGDFAPLCLFFETLLTQIWYPSTVATLSRRAHDVIEAAFEKGATGGVDSPLVPSRLHDFGMRGCCTGEQAVLGGCAHLLSFEGTDTMPAAFHAQYNLNGGEPVSSSIPATEHSVMTAWPTERDAILNMIHHFGDGTFACVMDSYDYAAALEKVLPSVAKEQVGKGGYLVLRPDSGDPVDAVLQAVHAADKVFGSETNGKGYKVIRGCGVIQGDGIDITMLHKISDAVLAAGFSPENVAYGMGGGLLQKVHRDSMSFATKLCHIVYADGAQRDVMKFPKTDTAKSSFPGRLAVRDEAGMPTVYPADSVSPEDDMLQVVYDCGPVEVNWPSFSEVRERVTRTWAALPLARDPISAEVKDKIERVTAETRAAAAKAQGV